MIDEGVIKFDCEWIEGPPPNDSLVGELNKWRESLYAAGFIGQYAGIGYGNISMRDPSAGTFIISGSQTGHLERLTGAHYSEVTSYDVADNRLVCRGPTEASSESLTHAALYEVDPAIAAVVHIHSEVLWAELRGRIPTTNPEVAYGTPEMAREFERLYRETDFAKRGIAVMAGHAGGLISIGHDVAQAAERFLELAEPIRPTEENE